MAVIGLVFDAERSRTHRKDEIKKWLEGAGFTPPKYALRLKESSLDGAAVRTAYLVNPHGENRGAIETYFLRQIQRTARWPCIEKLLECYERSDSTKVLREKLIVRTFIAHQNGRNTGLNAAFRRNILNCDDESLDPVRRFLSLLRDASPVQQSRERPRGTSNDT